MKVMAFTICLLIASAVNGQAHLGASELDIRREHPNNKWKTDFTNKGVKYISSDMIYGNFVYYFDKETGLSDLNIQIPFSQASMNGQVEAYNKKYVITSDTSWTAYLEDGGIIYIKLVYNEELKIRYFTYSPTK